MARTLALEWTHGRAIVDATAAMLVDAAFDLDGRIVRPFARAPWKADDPDVAETPGHLRSLGGDFVALPFGSAVVPPDAPEEWLRVAAPANDRPHGMGADADWGLRTADLYPWGSAVEAELELPADDPVDRLRRRIRGVPGRARIEFDLEVTSRRDHRSSLGLHPVLALPDGGTARIDVDFAWGRVWPGRLHAEGRPAPAARFDRLEEVPVEGGGTVDLSVLPPPRPTEEVVQLVGARSPFRFPVTPDAGVAYTVVLEWDDDALPSLLLWLSDRGIAAPPWRGRYRGLGVEPVASAFDFPVGTSLADNPLAAEGARTFVRLHAGAPWTTRHAVEVIV